MKSKNSSPAPKVSTSDKEGYEGPRMQPFTEHLEAGEQHGITEEATDTTKLYTTTTDDQEKMHKKINRDSNKKEY
jgi:hypothetical protein